MDFKSQCRYNLNYIEDEERVNEREERESERERERKREKKREREKVERDERETASE